MWVRITRNEAIGGQRYTKGTLLDVPDVTAREMFKLGMAEPSKGAAYTNMAAPDPIEGGGHVVVKVAPENQQGERK